MALNWVWKDIGKVVVGQHIVMDVFVGAGGLVKAGASIVGKLLGGAGGKIFLHFFLVNKLAYIFCHF